MTNQPPIFHAAHLKSTEPLDNLVRIIELGGHIGDSIIPRLNEFRNVELHVFEPDPHNFSILRQKANGDNRIILNNAAVGGKDSPRKLPFNIAPKGDRGCGSLYKFHPDRHKSWLGREDLVSNETIMVDVIDMNEYFQEYDIDYVDYWHSDIQNSDLPVLESLSKENLKKIKSGVFEVAESDNVLLYEEGKTIEDAQKFLDENGLRIYKCVRQQNEINVFFFDEKQVSSPLFCN